MTPAPAHHHVNARGEALVALARQALETRGEKWTRMRDDVFAVLASQERPASAYDIADRLSRSTGRRVAANSIYRILDLFVTTNLAQRIESINAYAVNPHPGCVHDCIYLICSHCGQTQHLDRDPLVAALRGCADAQGFAVGRPVIELHGRCGACQPSIDRQMVDPRPMSHTGHIQPVGGGGNPDSGSRLQGRDKKLRQKIAPPDPSA